MNKFKKLATLCMALVFSVGLTAFAACGTDTSSSKESSSANSVASSVEMNSSSASSEATSSSSDAGSSDTVAPVDGAYVFVVKHADGRAADDVCVQLCTADNSFCLQPSIADANGKVVCAGDAAEYVIHVYAVDENGSIVMDQETWENVSYEIDGSDITPAEHGVIYITLK